MKRCAICEKKFKYAIRAKIWTPKKIQKTQILCIECFLRFTGMMEFVNYNKIPSNLFEGE